MKQHSQHTRSLIVVLFNPYQHILSVYMLCETIELKSGALWKTLRRAGKQDLVAGEMVVVCPRCHVAFVVKDKEVEVTAPV